MKLVDGSQMAAVDAASQNEYGIPDIVLMEDAAIKAYERFCHVAPHDDARLLFVAGKGNNGGDALAMARHAFSDGSRVEVVSATTGFGRLAEVHRRVLDALGVSVSVWGSSEAEAMIGRADVIFDGLSGTGVRPPLRGSVVSLVERINASDAYVVAIDVPSGVGDGYRAGHPAVRADLTLTIGLPKRSLYLPAARPLCGRVEIVRIGFPPALTDGAELRDELADEKSVRGLLPKVPPEGYKGSRGRVGVFAGAPGTTGAAILCAGAAARSGAGLVYLHVDEAVYPVVASHLVSVMSRVLPSGEPVDVSRFDSLLVGPGWGCDGRRGLLERLLESDTPGVLDADGIRILSQLPVRDLGSRWILTPHPGELAALAAGEIGAVLDDPYEVGARVAARYNAVVVLKSHVTFVISPDGAVTVVDGMNPRLGTGGSGDVLAGIIAGFLARGAAPAAAAVCGAFVHARAGRLASERGWFLAEDLLPIVSRAAADIEGAQRA